MEISEKEVIVLHSTGGRPYFESIEYLKEIGKIKNVTYYETSVVKLFIKGILRKKKWHLIYRDLIKNIRFRFSVLCLRNKILILGMGPYDFRFPYYSLLSIRNKLIYHTSHPYWITDEKLPRSYLIFTPLLKKIWLKILKKQSIVAVAVTKSSISTFRELTSKVDGTYEISHSLNVGVFNRYANIDRNIGEPLKIFFVGIFLPEKGLSTIVEVMKKVDLDKYEFHFIGDGPYRDEFMSLSRGLSFIDHGFIKDKEKLAELLSTADILLVPSVQTKKWEELFGIVCIEGMASGSVVIASNHIGPREIITDGINGFLVPEKDSNYIINKLELMDSDRDMLKSMKKSAIAESKKYDIETISEKWMNVFEGSV